MEKNYGQAVYVNLDLKFGRLRQGQTENGYYFKQVP